MKYVKKYEELDLSKLNPFKKKLTEEEKKELEKKELSDLFESKFKEIKEIIDDYSDPDITIKFDKIGQFLSEKRYIFDVNLKNKEKLIKGLNADDIEYQLSLYKLFGYINISIRIKLIYNNNHFEYDKYETFKIRTWNVIYYNSVFNKTELTFSKSNEIDKETKIDSDFKDRLINYIKIPINSYTYDNITNLYKGVCDRIKDEIIKNKRIEEFNKNSEDILDMFYDIIDFCDNHEVRFDEKQAIYTFTFYFNFDYSKKGLFKLNKNLANFFTYLEDAKRRVKDLVMPEADFYIDIGENKITLVIK
jgi:hypothetical protein